MKVQLNLDDKPHLLAALKEDQQLAREVMQTFADLMDEAFNPDNGVRWADLPKKFHQNLTFRDLIFGILHGSLSLKDINPDLFDACQDKEEVHPLSMLSARRDHLNGGTRYVNWRNHYRLPQDAQINQETIATIFRKLLRYYKYVDIKKLAEALINNQIATFRSMDQAQNLPFYPALRYQLRQFGELHVGKFFDNIGFFDGGAWTEGDSTECPACQHPGVEKLGNYHVCWSCNIGFEEMGV